MKFDILKPEAISGSGKKAIQEDYIFPAVGEATIHDKLFVVADGIGDDGSGYKPAEYFARAFSDHMFQNTCSDEGLEEEVLRDALLAAKEKMLSRCADAAGIQFAILYLHRHGCLAAHLGSVRIYHIRPKDRLMLYKSKDDNRVFAPNQESLEEPTKACITNVQYGDYFILMTKGGHQAISDRELMDIICEPVNDKTKAARMMRLAASSDENFTVNIVHVSGVMNEALDERLFDNESQLMAAAGVVTAGNVAEATTSTENKPSDEQKVEKRKTEERQPVRENPPTKKEKVRKPVPVVDEEPEEEEEKEHKREFPIVTVTALALVLLAVGIWYWAQKPNEEPVIQETTTVKPVKEKDTINILKNTRPKLVTIDDPKAQENKEEEKKKEEKPVQVQNTTENSTVEPVNSGVDNDVTSPATQPAAPSNPTQVTPPAEPAAPPATQPTTPTNTGDPNTVAPKPVIPDGE